MGSVQSYEYSHDGKLLAVGTGNTRVYFVHLVDPAEDSLIRKWRVGKHGRGLILALSPDGQTVATATSEHPAVTLWDTATGRNRFPSKEAGTSYVLRMAVLPDGQTLVTQDRLLRVTRRNLETGEVTHEKVWTIPDSFESMGMSLQVRELLRPDLQRLVNEPELKDSQLKADVEQHRYRLKEARVSGDGNRVVVLIEPTLLNVYDRHSGKLLRKLADQTGERSAVNYMSGMALSADGSRVACYYRNHRQAWNVETGERLTTPPLGQWHFAPDGTLLIARKISGQPRREVVLWDVDEGKSKGTLSDAPHSMGAMAFSPDGKLMAHARGVRGWGNTDVVLWDLATRRVIRILRGARSGAAGLCFSPDGRKLYASDNATLTLVWDLSND